MNFAASLTFFQICVCHILVEHLQNKKKCFVLEKQNYNLGLLVCYFNVLKFFILGYSIFDTVDIFLQDKLRQWELLVHHVIVRIRFMFNLHDYF